MVTTPLVGAHQAANFAFTLALLDAAGGRFAVPLAEAVAAASSIQLPGRFQRVGRWLFDVAHNPDGARTLASSIGALSQGTPVTVLLCVLADKDWRAMLDALATVATRFVLTHAPTAPPSRRWELAEVVQYAATRGYAVQHEPDFDAALRLAQIFDGELLVTGSFHTVGDAMSRLLVDPLAR